MDPSTTAATATAVAAANAASANAALAANNMGGGCGDEIDDDVADEYKSASSMASTSGGPLSTYIIYINENCCVEISASQKGSSVKNLITQVSLVLY